MACRYCENDYSAGYHVSHPECRAELDRRVDAGTCVFCDSVDAIGGACSGCNTMDKPSFAGYHWPGSP